MNTEQIMALVTTCAAQWAKATPKTFAATYGPVQAAIEALVQERDAAQADALEQARLCGMGGEREADLLGKVARLEAELEKVKLHIKHIGNDALRAENQALRDALEDVHNWSPDGSNAKNLAAAALTRKQS